MGLFGAAWGITGVSLLLSSAIVRLAPRAWETALSPLALHERAALILVVLGMAFFEGYLGFQRAFSPRVAARGHHLSKAPTPLRVILAPLFCLAFFGAPRRRQVASIVVSLAIAALVVGVRFVAAPWRGIIDAGVVVGLTWGLVALWIFTVRAFSAQGLDHPAEVSP